VLGSGRGSALGAVLSGLSLLAVPRRGRLGRVGSHAPGGWDRLRLAASPKVPRSTRLRSWGGYKPTAAPFSRGGNAIWMHRPLWGVGTSVEGAIGPGAAAPLGVLRRVCLLPTLWLPCVGSANAGTGPLLSSYLAGDFRGSVADASPPCCGAEGGPLLGFTPPLPLDGALYCQQGLACSWHHPWFGAVRGRIRSGEPGPESLPPSLFSLRCPSSPHRYRG
jgi:hypothetical protein